MAKGHDTGKKKKADVDFISTKEGRKEAQKAGKKKAPDNKGIPGQLSATEREMRRAQNGRHV